MARMRLEARLFQLLTGRPPSLSWPLLTLGNSPHSGASFTVGRFPRAQITKANPSFVLDPVALETLESKGITVEPAYGTTGWQ